MIQHVCPELHWNTDENTVERPERSADRVFACVDGIGLDPSVCSRNEEIRRCVASANAIRCILLLSDRFYTMDDPDHDVWKAAEIAESSEGAEKLRAELMMDHQMLYWGYQELSYALRDNLKLLRELLDEEEYDSIIEDISSIERIVDRLDSIYGRELAGLEYDPSAADPPS